jgi:hypothetical protein
MSFGGVYSYCSEISSGAHLIYLDRLRKEQTDSYLELLAALTADGEIPVSMYVPSDRRSGRRLGRLPKDGSFLGVRWVSIRIKSGVEPKK